ncbi:MAG: RsmB/NOP family class I SAM-dependent RNA methyltransferase [Candidatus Parvarchaeota archaeon]|nr:RsmB/NOP family class I SAM-dependent RNA methyltransferase [Candidatus Jingweiarchaeum tengchongense]MCW1297731.1 RsmB/NOP family class I SAM-dependent RNA methyltransferase [Candidatus Jingweiarchaeum tengchongense]MCW1299741.1 RsmB/NOP family class I SAM-dependent RNA methyltransferase [Candidatus Jingweiarchaeum tengchongense]MCW1304288.1 RsmB/NOP family class I SAM-dependent RNA methyltransferase [Candidatus Jingweiarchaeum tengchongense]MCW1305315.1 RsmB/NOP family class I SAM-dependen
MKFKEDFIARFKILLGNELEEFLEYSKRFLRTSIRINTLKINIDECKRRLIDKGWRIEQVPWCESGFYVYNAPSDIGNTIEHCLGYYYVQEAASMIPVETIDECEYVKILDLCASPGSKTTQIAQKFRESVIVANDVRIDRIKILSSNLQRCGVINTIVTMEKGERFHEHGIKFDLVFVDPSCSSEGAIRKNFKIMEMWNVFSIKKFSKLQKKLIESGFNCLNKNGTLVYSTCTLAPEENEEVVDYLLNRYENASVERINLKIKSRPGIEEWENKKYNDEVKKCMRIYPQDNDTEGFFVAKIKKL